MIESYSGEKVSPKKKAQEIIADAINQKIEFLFEQEFEHTRITPVEMDRVIEQVYKIKEQIFRNELGYRPSLGEVWK